MPQFHGSSREPVSCGKGCLIILSPIIFWSLILGEELWPGW